jgi:hypothetical protein
MIKSDVHGKHGQRKQGRLPKRRRLEIRGGIQQEMMGSGNIG